METEFLSAVVNSEIGKQVSESGKPALKRQDVFRRILGPTPDETILTGLQIVVDMCSPETFVIPTSYYPPYQIENETALTNESLETPISHHLDLNYKTVQTQPSSIDTPVQVTYETETQPLSKETKPVQVTQEVGTQPSNMDVKPIHVASSDKTTKRDTIRNHPIVLPCLINNNAKFKTTATETQDLVPALEYDSNFEQTSSSFVDYVDFPYFSKEVNTSCSLEQLTQSEHQSADTPSYYQQNSKIGDESDISSEITILRTKTRVLENSGLGDVSFESGYTEGALTSNFPHKSISAYWNIKSSDYSNSCPCSCSESIYKDIEVEVAAVEPVSWNGNPKIPLKANSSEFVGKRKVFTANKKNEVGNEYRPMMNKRKPSSAQFQRRKTSFTPSSSAYCSNIINEIPTLTKLNDSCIQTSKCKHKVKDDDNQSVEKSTTCENLKPSKNSINENKTKAGKCPYYVDKEVCKPTASSNAEEKNPQAKPKRYKYEPKESMKSRFIQFADEICSARTFYEEKKFGIDTLKENLPTPAKAVLDEYKRKVPTNDDWSFHSKAQSLTPLQCHSVQTIISLGSDKSSCNYLSKFYLSLQKQSITRSVQTTESSCTSTHVQTTESSCTSTHVQTCRCNPIAKSVQTSTCEFNTKSERKLEIYSTIFQGPQSSEVLRTVDNNSSLSGSSKEVKYLNYSQSQNSHQLTEVAPYTDTSTPPSKKSIDSLQSFTKESSPAFKSTESERFSYLYCKQQSGNLREPQSKPPSLTARSFDKSKQLHVRTTKSRKRSSGVSPWSHEKPKALSGKPAKVGNHNCENVGLNKSFNKNNSCFSKARGNSQDTSGNSNESLIILPAPRDLDWTPIRKGQGCHTQECIKNFEQKCASKLPKHSEKHHIWQENGYVCSTENTKDSYSKLPSSNSEHSKGLSGKLSGIGKFLKMFPRRTKNDT